MTTFENAAKARHEFEDALKRLLRYLAVMTDRELELSRARIADQLVNASTHDPFSARCTGRVLQVVLHLRSQGALKQARLRRLAVAKRELASGPAVVEHARLVKTYEAALLEQRLIETSYKAELINWKRRYKRLPFLARLLRPPPQPQQPTGRVISLPPSVTEIEQQLARARPLDQLLIDAAVYFRFPFAERFEAAVDDTSVRDTARMLQ